MYTYMRPCMYGMKNDYLINMLQGVERRIYTTKTEKKNIPSRFSVLCSFQYSTCEQNRTTDNSSLVSSEKNNFFAFRFLLKLLKQNLTRKIFSFFNFQILKGRNCCQSQFVSFEINGPRKRRSTQR